MIVRLLIFKILLNLKIRKTQSLKNLFNFYSFNMYVPDQSICERLKTYFD